MNDALERARELLRPHFGSEDARRACFVSAFFPENKDVLEQIDFSGTAVDFTEHCVLVLDGYGPIDGRPALYRLLEAVRSRVGPQRQLEFDEVMHAMNGNDPTGFEYDVFLSHNSKDKPAVRKMAERLRGDGLRVWFDEWVIRTGDDIYLQIEKGLEESRALVLFMSPDAFGSDWVSLERSTSLFRDPANRQRRFTPLLLADCKIPDVLRRYKFVDFRKGEESAYRELLVACQAEQTEPEVAKSASNLNDRHENSRIKKSELRQAIDRGFDLGELKLLCADLDEDLKAAGKDLIVSLDAVGGDAKAVRIQNLIDHLDRRGCLDFLVQAVRRQRPGSI